MNLTREQFAYQVFARDNNTCVVPGCGRKATAPHHILERRLFTDGDPLPGGYDLDNGASLCDLHHLHAEAGHFPPAALRRWIKAEKVVLPTFCHPDNIYDKWGNLIPSAPKKHVKYPKTPYFNFSPSYENGDRYIDNKDLLGKPLAVTIKKDGSCVTLSKVVCAARNGHEARHQSFDMLKARHAALRDGLPDGVQIFGEWLFAKHSITYTGILSLKDYLEVFAVYDQKAQLFYSQDETADFCKERGLLMVQTIAKVMYEADWQLVKGIMSLAKGVIEQGHEGVVVKSCYPFHYTQFAINAGKYVKPNHVQTALHWTRQEIQRNDLVA